MHGLADTQAVPSLRRLREQVQAAQQTRQPVRILGSGSKDFYGQSLSGQPLSMLEHHGITSYEPTELVITARAGTRLTELQAVLAECHQMLAFEPPAFGDGATIGGVIASGLSGPRRVSAGAAKDFVLGAVLLDIKGEQLHFGGQVMKNVAGYDLSRLLCGSMGILGPITEVSIKVLPVPPLEVTVRGHCDQKQALVWLNQWGGQPLPLSASFWADGELSVRLSGAVAAVQSAQNKLKDLAGLQAIEPHLARTFWSEVREQDLPMFAGPQLWRLSVPSTSPELNTSGFTVKQQCIEWGGALRWITLDAPDSPAQAAEHASLVRQLATAYCGTASLWRAMDKSVEVFHPLDAVNLRIHQRLKAEFDPVGIFNPGRLSPLF